MPDVDLTEFETRRGPAECIVARQLTRLSDQDQEKFVAALAAPWVSTSKITERFWARELKIGRSAVDRHRKGQCCCER